MSDPTANKSVTRYHINPQTGDPGMCRARNACPYGRTDEHYSSPGEAQQAYEDTHSNLPANHAQHYSPEQVEEFVVNSLDGTFRVQEMFDANSRPRTVAINSLGEVVDGSGTVKSLPQLLKEGWEQDGEVYDPRPQALSHQLESRFPIKVALTHRTLSNHVSIDGLIVNKDIRREGVVAINPQMYWKSGDPVEIDWDLIRRRRGQEIASIKRGEQFGLWTLLSTVGILGRAWAWLSSIANSSTHIELLFTQDDDGLQFLQQRHGRLVAKLIQRDKIHVEEMLGMNHPMHRAWKRNDVVLTIHSALDRMTSRQNSRIL